MEWIMLLVAIVLYGAGCCLTYAEEYKKLWWYIPFGVFLGALTNMVWFYVVKQFDSKQRMYVYSIIWDSTLMLVYYGLPLIFFGAKLNRWIVLGLILVVVGMMIVKIKN